MAKQAKKKSYGTPRLNIRVPEDLTKWAKEYAQRKNTTVTELIVTYLRVLRAQDTEIPQI